MKFIIITSIVILSINISNAQQVIQPNIKHDWENGRYIINADNTVVDIKTQLIWKRCPLGLSDINCDNGGATQHNWKDALELAENSTFAGFSDWRLPTIKELRTLAAYDRYNPAINSTVFPNLFPISVWSSSPTGFNTALIMNFLSGRIVGTFRDGNSYVRLVRGG